MKNKKQFKDNDERMLVEVAMLLAELERKNREHMARTGTLVSRIEEDLRGLEKDFVALDAGLQQAEKDSIAKVDMATEKYLAPAKK